jgi:hypothetical protein
MGLPEHLRSRLTIQFDTLRTIIHYRTEAELRERINPEKWSAFEQIAHLTAYQPVFIKRIDSILAEHSPAFGRYVADEDDYFRACVKLPLQNLLDDLGQKRLVLVEKVSKLNENQLIRVGKHLKYGEMDLATWLDFFLLHEAHHLFSIFMLIQEGKSRQTLAIK